MDMYCTCKKNFESWNKMCTGAIWKLLKLWINKWCSRIQIRDVKVFFWLNLKNIIKVKHHNGSTQLCELVFMQKTTLFQSVLAEIDNLTCSWCRQSCGNLTVWQSRCNLTIWQSSCNLTIWQTDNQDVIWQSDNLTFWQSRCNLTDGWMAFRFHCERSAANLE